MSIVAFKKKSIINYGTKRSGKQPGGYWLPQGPFGHSTTALKQAIQNYGAEGFSINGGHRNVGYIGKDSKFSRNGTPFRGKYPYGSGGTFGKYAQPEPVYNVNRVIVLGDQYLYVKPSVLSTYGLLQKKYRWAHNGQYPNYWVQPLVGGTWQSDSATQGVYLHNKTAANTRYINVNDTDKYKNYIVNHGPTLCYTSTAKFKFSNMVSNAPYTKELSQPIQSSEYTTYIQRRCVNPLPRQKPFPYAVQTGSGQTVSGTSVRSFGNACNTSNIYLSPPDWYTDSSNGKSSNGGSNSIVNNANNTINPNINSDCQ
jgi:hypothetical protein